MSRWREDGNLTGTALWSNGWVMATGVLAAMRAVSIPLGSFNVPGLLLSAVLAVVLNLVLPKEAAEAVVETPSTGKGSGTVEVYDGLVEP